MLAITVLPFLALFGISVSFVPGKLHLNCKLKYGLSLKSKRTRELCW